MDRAAAHDHAERDHRVEGRGAEEALHGDGDLVRARDADHGERSGRHPGGAESRAHLGDEGVDQLQIVAGGDDPDPQRGSVDRFKRRRREAHAMRMSKGSETLRVARRRHNLIPPGAPEAGAMGSAGRVRFRQRPKPEMNSGPRQAGCHHRRSDPSITSPTPISRSDSAHSAVPFRSEPRNALNARSGEDCARPRLGTPSVGRPGVRSKVEEGFGFAKDQRPWQQDAAATFDSTRRSPLQLPSPALIPRTPRIPRFFPE